MTPLLLVPGTLCDAALFAPQAAALGDIASIQIADTASDDSIDAMAARALAVAPPRFALAGLSMGGAVALQILRRAPERVERLALLDTHPHADAPARRAARARQWADMQRIGLRRVLTEQIGPGYLAADDPALLASIVEMGLRLGSEAFARQSRALAGRIDQTATLRAATCPALVLCGAADQVCRPALHVAMARLLAGSELVVIDGAGHLPTMEQPAATNAALRRWLTAGPVSRAMPA